MQSRFNQVCDIILDKNPSLIREICKQIDAHNPSGDMDTQSQQDDRKKGDKSSRSN
jgi:hypothetical protein